MPIAGVVLPNNSVVCRYYARVGCELKQVRTIQPFHWPIFIFEPGIPGPGQIASEDIQPILDMSAKDRKGVTVATFGESAYVMR